MSFPQYPEYKDSGVEWLGEVPAHWEVSRLKFFGDLITGITPPSEDLTNYAEAGWPWIRPDDLDDQGKPVQASRFLTEQGWAYCRPIGVGSTLVCCIGSIGKLGYTQELACTNQQVTAIQPFYDPRHLFYLVYASKPELDLRATGNVLRILNAERLGNVPAVMPPADESAHIAAFLDHETSRIDALVEEQQRLIELLKEKRQAVISHAVTKGLDPDVPMKDSGVEWLGEVPAHWAVLSLRRVTDFIQTGGTPSMHPPSEEIDGGLDWFTPGDFGENLVLGSSTRKVRFSTGISEDVKIFPSGSVYVVGIGATLGKVGYAAQAASANQQINVLVPSSRIDGYFLAYSMSEKKEAMKVASNASTIGIMNQDKTKGLIIAIPPKEEQESIVDYLDEIVSRNNKLIKQAEQGVTLLQERRSALISAAVTGKIDVRGWQASQHAEQAEVLLAAEERAAYVYGKEPSDEV